MKVTKSKRLLALLALATVTTITTASAEVVPSNLFRDHMVLQQGMPVPIWGEADSSEKVTVRFSGQTKRVTADKDGKWMVRLDALKASSRGMQMEISGSNKIKFRDVLVGEVWICSGQSNMEMKLESVPDVKSLLRRVSDVRHFEVERTVAFEAQEGLNGEWKKGGSSSAVAAGFSDLLEKSSDVPVGIILSCWGSSSLEAWMPRDMTEKLPIFKRQMNALDSDTEAKARIQSVIDSDKPRKMADDIFLRRQPNLLYNAMMAPLSPYACRGVVWYQGERNAANFNKAPARPWYRQTIPMTGYGEALKLWIQRYRKEWQRDDLHFMLVMLPGYAKGLEKKAESPVERSWAWMREAQLEALELPYVSVVNTIDLGHPTNAHPVDKLPICERLNLLAQRDTLSMNTLAEGPVMKKVEKRVGSLIVYFDHDQGLKTQDGKAPLAFWISQDAKKWKPAVAELKKDRVILSAPGMSRPKYIRYAFSAKPQTNLTNATGLPTRPFRTDSADK